MFDLMMAWLKLERAETCCQLYDILHNNNNNNKQLLCLTYISYFDTYKRNMFNKTGNVRINVTIRRVRAIIFTVEKK